MTVFAVLVTGCAPEAPVWTPPPQSYARLPDRPMTLTTTDVAPGELAGFRIVGGLPLTQVSVIRGAVGQGSTCPGPLGGACVDVAGKVKKVGTALTDANGSVLIEVSLPGGVPVGDEIGFQAYTTDTTTSTTYVSNLVTVTTLSGAPPQPPGGNTLIVLVDDLGIDRIGLYGATDPAITPRLDSLASDGIVFENAWAMPWCAPTRASLQTGRYPRRTGYGENPGNRNPIELDPNLISIAELVEHSPYLEVETSYVGKWHLSAFESSSSTLGPIVQGWDWWSGSLANLGAWHGLEQLDRPGYWYWQKVDNTGATAPWTTYATTDTVDDALDRLAVMAEPWLLQVSFQAAHSPYHVPPADLHTDTGLLETSPESELHRAMVQAMDTEMGRLLDGIDQAVLDRTTVFFLGDNGTPLQVLDDNDVDGRGKGTLFEAGVRVPFVVAGPLVGVPGGRSEALVHVVDVFPTIAEIVGVDTGVLRGSLDPEVPAVLDGYSLLPTLADPTVAMPRTTLFAELFEPGGAGPYRKDQRAIRDANYRLIVDALCGAELFFELTDGVLDEGPNLLNGPDLTVEQQAGLDNLRGELATIMTNMVYDSATYPPSTEVPPDCGGDTGDTGA